MTTTNAPQDGDMRDDPERGTGATSPPSPWNRDASRSLPGMHGSDQDASRLARGLGWLGIGLGVAGLLAPRGVARAIGVPDRFDTRLVLRAFGLREVATGVGVLTQPRPDGWIWARLAGDALDLAVLGKAVAAGGTHRGRAALTMLAVTGVTAADARASIQLAQASPPEARTARPRADQATHARAAITVNAPVERVYSAWEGFQNLPRFMGDFAKVDVRGDRRSRWSATLPGGISVNWEIEITDAVPNEMIAWRTAEGSPLPVSGQVRFRPAPGNRGTEIGFEARFNPPGGEVGQKIGALVAAAVGQKIGNDLRRFKQLIELGEIVKSDDSIVPGPNPAQPVARPNAA